MPMPDIITDQQQGINVHVVEGDQNAVTYLHDADHHWVEGLFLRAKMRGQAEFKFRGHYYLLRRNRNLTYRAMRKPEEDSPFNIF